MLLLLTAGCGAMPSSGPSVSDISMRSSPGAQPDHLLIDIDSSVVQILAQHRTSSLANKFTKPQRTGDQRVAVGDVVHVSIYEAAGGGLFNQGDAAVTGGGVQTQLPPQIVDQGGRINVPYVGPIKVASLSVRDIERLVQKQLGQKAIEPQVIVSIADKRGSSVTVAGDVKTPGRVPLLTGSERMLDILSLSGGTSAPAYESHVQLTRGSVSETMLLSDIVANPKENIYLAAGDSVFVTKVPRSYVILGAALRGAEVPFDLERLSLAQAVGRAGGLDDRRADPSGVFVFRYEDSTVAQRLSPAAARFAGLPRVPVIYRADLRDPRVFFNIQAFEVRNRDLLYIANADAAQLTKFLVMIGTGVGIVRSVDAASAN